MPIIAQLMTMKKQTRCLQLETYLWLYFGILGLYPFSFIQCIILGIIFSINRSIIPKFRSTLI